MTMNKSNAKYVLAIFLLAVLLVLGSVVFQMTALPKGGSPAAKLRNSEPLERYRKSIAARAPAPAQSAPTAQPETTAPTDSIAAYANMFVRASNIENARKWADLSDLLGRTPPKDWTSEDWARLKDLMEEARDLLGDIRAQAQAGGPAQVLDLSKGLALELPHLAPLRSLARLLRYDALVQAHDGNPGQAVDDVIAILQLATALKEEPILISQLVRCAIEGIASSTAQEMLPPQGLPNDLALKLIAAASNCAGRDAMADCLLGEGFIGLATFDKIRNGNTDSMVQNDSLKSFGLRVYGSIFARPLLNKDEAAYADILSRTSNASRLPYYQAAPLLAQIENDIEALPRTRVVSHTILPALTRAVLAQARDEASLGMLQVGLALEIYHAEHSAYPAVLDAIAGTLGGTIPVDPFTGQPFVYRILGDSFLLYSVGENGTDDGGRFDYKKGDIVWRETPEPRNAGKNGRN